MAGLPERLEDRRNLTGEHVLLVNPRRFTCKQLIRNAVTNIRTLLPWRSLQVLAYLLAATWSLRADQIVSLGWRASPDPRATGYTVVYGNASGAYTQSTNVGNVTQAAVAGLAQGQTYYFAVYAYGGLTLESGLSNEVSYQIPSAPAPLTINWSNPADIIYGTPIGSQQLNATASVPGSFAYTPPPGTVLPAGPGQSLQAVFLPTDQLNYAPVTNYVQIKVQKAPLTITAGNKSKAYGASLPALTASYSGFVNGDTVASLTTPATLSTTATAASAVGTYPITASGASSPNYNLSFVSGTLTISSPAATVVSRLIFYNNSAWDGRDPAANVQDDAAIATDKAALLPGGIATLKNYTSYSRGINGIIVDIAGLGGTPAVDDFAYKTGNDNNPATWASAPPPSSITVRPGAGVGGADRVTLIWPDNAVQKNWLEVTVLATENTQLANPDVFYFGNAIGESGNRTDNAKVDPADELRARANQRTLLDPAPIDFPCDYNRDKRVDPADQLIARATQTVLLNSLKLINLSASGLSGLTPTLSSTGTKQLSPAAFSAGTQTQSSPTPTAPAPSRLTAGLNGQGRLVLAYVSDADQPCQLQSTEDVSDDSWTDADLPEPTLHGTVRRWVLAIEEGESQRFYRMISILPSMQKGIAQ